MKGIKNYYARLAAGIAFLACSMAVQAEGPTAFSLAKEGNRYIGEQAKDKIVQIRSEKSVGSLVPNVWFVVYYDPTATLKAVEVKFADGRMIDVKRPMRLIEPITGDDKVLDHDKLRIDSDKAIAIAVKDPALDRLTLRATKVWLQRGDEGSVWKIRFWADKFRNPGEDADIDDIYVSATDGKIVKYDVHPDRLS
jgi:hypothetical protein